MLRIIVSAPAAAITALAATKGWNRVGPAAVTGVIFTASVGEAQARKDVGRLRGAIVLSVENMPGEPTPTGKPAVESVEVEEGKARNG